MSVKTITQPVNIGPGSGLIRFLQGNNGGPVGPNAAQTIFVIGGNNITVSGNPFTFTETIAVTGNTNHSVLLGNATGSINSLVNGTTGQVLHAVTGANDPIWAAVSLTVDVTGVLPIANGGTNASSMTNTFGVNYFDGTRIVTTTVGTAGQLLTSNGVGVAPTFQAPAASSITLTADSGGPLVSGSFTLAGGLNMTTSGAGTTITFAASQAQLLTNYRVANFSPFVVNSTDFYITVDTSAIPITIQLPDAPTIYRRFVIKDSAGNAGTLNISVTTVSGLLNIDAATTYTMNTNWEAIELVYDGFGYQVF